MDHTTLIAWFAFGGIAALALMAAIALAPYSHIAKRFRNWETLAIVVVATLYGGTKPPPPVVQRDNYLTGIVRWVFETNVVGTVTNYNATGLSLSWRLANADLAPIIPTDSPVYIEATQNAGTNYTLIASTTLGAGGWEGAIENATNYQYYVWLDWAPPAPVATNGVYHLNLAQPVPNRFVPIRIKVEVDGDTITPTPED